MIGQQEIGKKRVAWSDESRFVVQHSDESQTLTSKDTNALYQQLVTVVVWGIHVWLYTAN